MANLVYEDGTEIPLNTVITIKDATNSSKTRTYSSENSYKVTVTANTYTTQDSSAGANSRKISSFLLYE